MSSSVDEGVRAASSGIESMIHAGDSTTGGDSSLTSQTELLKESKLGNKIAWRGPRARVHKPTLSISSDHSGTQPLGTMSPPDSQ